jgi:hypothetical protein
MDKLTGVRLQERSRKDPVVSAPLVGQENTCSRLDHSGGGSAAVEVFTAPGSVNLNLPDITVTPLSLDFGSIPINNLAAQLVTVKNDGVLDLTIGGVTFGGVNINQFSKSTDKFPRRLLRQVHHALWIYALSRQQPA